MSLTNAEDSMSRNSSQRISRRAARAGGGSVRGRDHQRQGAIRSARKPVSSKRLSHWNHRKSSHTLASERYTNHEPASDKTGAIPTMSKTESSAPAAHRR